VSQSNWRPIAEAPRGIGPLLLRCGNGPNDPAFVGAQGDDGLWYFNGARVPALYFATIPVFDLDEGTAVDGR
jgi:hypothetical protein